MVTVIVKIPTVDHEWLLHYIAVQASNTASPIPLAWRNARLFFSVPVHCTVQFL